jgi:hypothetical protein
VNRSPIIYADCKGPNACRRASKAGRPVHIVPPRSSSGLSVVLPTYHYATEVEARDALALAEASAPLVTCDSDLFAYRAQRIAYKLPVGWVDPSRRFFQVSY